MTQLLQVLEDAVARGRRLCFSITFGITASSTKPVSSLTNIQRPVEIGMIMVPMTILQMVMKMLMTLPRESDPRPY